MIKPKALQPGDTVGLVSPSSPVHIHAHVTDEMLALGRKRLEDLGLKTVLGRNALKIRGYLAGSDEERAADINEMFADPQIQGIICIQGGYGSPRILPYLDYELIRNNPKVFVGYSDITGLHCALAKLANLVTFHGPMAGYDISKEWEYTRDWFEKAVMSKEPLGLLANPCQGPKMETLCGGEISAPIIGGNLSLLISTLGTPYELDTEGKILLIEDVGEVTYRFDRMLAQLKLAGKLDQALGFIVADCVDCGPGNTKRLMLSLEEVLADFIEPLGKPAIYGLAAGHGDQRLTLPLGVTAKLDADRTEITFTECGVV